MLYSPEESAVVRSFHELYRRGRLQILVGDQISSEAGLPFGRALFEDLFLSRLSSVLEKRNSDFAVLSVEQIERLSSRCLDTWQSEALSVLDLLDPSQDATLFSALLYDGKPRSQLQSSSLHKRLAVMEKGRLFSTCLDPLLARAAEQLGLKASPEVRHLCGSVPCEGDGSKKRVRFPRSNLKEIHPPFVLESAIGQLYPSAALAAELRTIFKSGPVLVLGFAVEEKALGWVLSQRARGAGSSAAFKSAPCAAILVRPEEGAQQWAIEQLLRHAGVQPIWIDSLPEAEPILRDITYGLPKEGEPPLWLANSIRWRQTEKELSEKAIFAEQWQAAALTALRSFVDQLNLCFAPGAEEVIEDVLLLPMQVEARQDARLCIAATSSPLTNVSDPRTAAQRFSLGLGRGREQGMSGLAFSTGLIMNSADEDSETGPELNFDREMREQWYEDSFRQWRSILSIPVLDSAEWLPVAVLAITSNLAEPFWLRLSPKHREEMLAAARRTAKDLLAGAKEFIGMLGNVAAEVRTLTPEDSVIKEMAGNLRQTLFKPASLANYAGFLCATSEGDWKLQRGANHRIEVSLRKAAAPPVSAPVQISDGVDAATAEFDVEITADQFEFYPYSVRLNVAAGQDSSPAVFTCTNQPKRAGGYEIHVQLYQKTRLVQVLSCKVTVL